VQGDFDTKVMGLSGAMRNVAVAAPTVR